MTDNSLFPEFEKPVTEEPTQFEPLISEKAPSEEEFAPMRPTRTFYESQSVSTPPTYTAPSAPINPTAPTYVPTTPPVRPTPQAYTPMTPPVCPTPQAYAPTVPPVYAPPTPPVTPTYARPTRPTAKAKKKKGMGLRIALIAICCALVGSIVGGGLVGYYFSQKEETAQTEKAQTNQQSTINQVTVITPPSSLAELYDNAVPSIVGITNEYTTYDYFGSSTAGATGTGFIITSDGEILTNYHVVENAQKLTVTLYDGTEYPAKLLGYEAESDVALLKIDAENLPALPLGNSDVLNVGDQIAAIGNPLGELTYTMTVGYVSAKGRAVYTDEMPINMMQIDAAINSGNSGGPLFNLAGQVIGITTAKYSGSISGSANIEGIGFAIPINDVLSILDDLREYGSVQNRAYIGVVVTNSQAGGDIPAGALIQSVEKNSSGDKAGLRVSDIIIAVGDSAVSGIDTLYQALRPYRAGDTVELTVFRSGDTLTLSITFDATPGETTQESTEPSTEGFEFPWG